MPTCLSLKTKAIAGSTLRRLPNLFHFLAESCLFTSWTRSGSRFFRGASTSKVTHWDITFAEVPEPGAGLLFACAAGMAMLLTRRIRTDLRHRETPVHVPVLPNLDAGA